MPFLWKKLFAWTHTHVAVKLSVFLDLSLKEEYLLPLPIFFYDMLFGRNGATNGLWRFYIYRHYYSFAGISVNFNTVLGSTFYKKFMTDILNPFFLYVFFVECPLIQYTPEDGHVGLKHVEVLTTCNQHKEIN
jgi:hypothetical protein